MKVKVLSNVIYPSINMANCIFKTFISKAMYMKHKLYMKFNRMENILIHANCNSLKLRRM